MTFLFGRSCFWEMQNIPKHAISITKYKAFCTISASTSAEITTKEKYGYVKSETGFLKRDKNMESSAKIGFISLPGKLKESLNSFYKENPRKQITEDGIKLSLYLKNRGRPTHTTWTKYKRQKRREANFFNIEDAKETTQTKKEGHQITGLDELPIRPNRVKRPSREHYSVVRYRKREAAAYVASQAPGVYAATYRVLNEIKRRVPDFAPKTLLDFGSGIGMTVWAAHQLWHDSVKEYQCVDVSEDMNKTAEYLLRGSSDINSPLKVPNVYFKKFLPFSNQIKYDVIVSSFALTELPFRSQRLQAIKSLWSKTNDFLVIIDTGNNEGFDVNLQARQFLLGSLDEMDDYEGEMESNEDDDIIWFGGESFEEGHIFSPCPHELVCARTYVETRDHPCNFSQKTELPFALRNTAMKSLSYYEEKFSYLVLRKGRDSNSSDDKSWTRILQQPKVRKRHVICELCCSNGNIEKHVLTKKKDPFIYKAARHCVGWGDMLPINETQRPMNIRRPILPAHKRGDPKNTN